MTTLRLEVRKDRLDTTRLSTLADEPLADGRVRVRIDRFAYTSNNITYAAFGDAMHYWEFFPVAADADGTRWGCIPVWGFGTVVESRHPEVPAGCRLYGYWPTASHAVLEPVRVSPRGFSDGAAHRASLHAVYNRYERCDADPFYTADSEDLQALGRPLFTTAWLIDDFLADQDFFGIARDGQRGLVLLSSASSKTALATAAMLSRRPQVEVVGLTSRANLPFCESLGVYGRVVPYDGLDALPADAPCVYVDFAGNGTLRRELHTRFTAMAYSCSVGGTHVEQLAGSRDLPGPKPVLFFAPAQVRKRTEEWGAAEFDRRLVEAWHDFRHRARATVPPWIVAQHHDGPAAVQAAHALVLAGRGDPRVGHVLSLAVPG